MNAICTATLQFGGNCFAFVALPPDTNQMALSAAGLDRLPARAPFDYLLGRIDGLQHEVDSLLIGLFVLFVLLIVIGTAQLSTQRQLRDALNQNKTTHNTGK